MFFASLKGVLEEELNASSVLAKFKKLITGTVELPVIVAYMTWWLGTVADNPPEGKPRLLFLWIFLQLTSAQAYVGCPEEQREDFESVVSVQLTNFMSQDVVKQLSDEQCLSAPLYDDLVKKLLTSFLSENRSSNLVEGEHTDNFLVALHVLHLAFTVSSQQRLPSRKREKEGLVVQILGKPQI